MVAIAHLARQGGGIARVAALLAVASLGCRFGAAAPERIVLVTIDTLRADHIGCYGLASAHTPTLDRLAAEGVRYEVALSPAPLTLPSHTTIMTGLDPDRHGVRHNSVFSLDPAVPTLAERLHARGYATAAFVGAFVLDRRFGLARGFDVYDDHFGDRRSSLVGFAERRAGDVTDAFQRWLAAAPPRFFVWLHYYDAHASYDPPEGFKLSFPYDLYSGEIAYVDAQLGRALEALSARFDPAGTLVLVTSDHGESLGEHGELSHSYGVYEATQRVPLVARGPGFTGGRVAHELARLADVTPTLLAEAGAEPISG
ncbi:MAG TPA: sulfatase, partial [Myxococcota bacterium]|nr:sulfatase [Myxococcota bacterium]